MAKIDKPSFLQKIWASLGVKVSPSDSKISNGWNSGEIPASQNENWSQNRQDQAIAHISQAGIPEWDANTEYQGNFSWTLGSNGNLYACKITHTNQNPVTDLSETYWTKVLDRTSVLRTLDTTSWSRGLLTQASESAAFNYLNISSLGKNIVQSSNASAVRGLIGAGSVGSVVFQANTTSSARSAIGVVSANDTTEGLVRRATDAEAISGVNDTAFLTPKKLKLGFSILAIPNNGFLRFPSFMGSLELRWGSLLVPSNSSVGATSYPNTCLIALASLGMNSTNDFQPPKAYITGTGAVIYNSDSNTVTARWFAIGY